MALRFRNLEVTPGDPVEDWGFEGLLAAVDRGDLADWRRAVAAVRLDPWGTVATALEQALAAAEDTGAAESVRAALEQVRAEAEADERAQVAARLRECVARSGLTRREFAERLGTSASRLSTYLNGRVTPGATLLVRAEGIVDRAVRGRGSGR